MNADWARRVGVYAIVAVVVLLYVALTTPAGPAVATASATTAAGGIHAPLVGRLGMAAAGVAVWITVDGLVVRFWRGGDWMIFYLVRVLIGWGALLSLGAVLSAGHQRLLAAAIVFTVTAAFVGIWMGALAMRRASSS